jgi:hypothetical protein
MSSPPHWTNQTVVRGAKGRSNFTLAPPAGLRENYEVERVKDFSSLHGPAEQGRMAGNRSNKVFAAIMVPYFEHRDTLTACFPKIPCIYKGKQEHFIPDDVRFLRRSSNQNGTSVHTGRVLYSTASSSSGQEIRPINDLLQPHNCIRPVVSLMNLPFFFC